MPRLAGKNFVPARQTRRGRAQSKPIETVIRMTDKRWSKRWNESTLLVGLAGAVLLWSAFPPLNLWPLAWVAPVFWVWLVQREQLPGSRLYWTLYLVGLLHWLAVIHWVRLPHWSAYFGWLALSLYLGCYLPAFVGLSRLTVRALRVPIWLAVPSVWCALEWVRGYAFTGFALALIGHTQIPFLPFVQFADLVGACGVSWVMLMVSCGLASALPNPAGQRTWTPLVLSLVLVLAASVYGSLRLARFDTEASGETVKVALIQGCIDTTFDSDEDPNEAFGQYLNLSRQVVRQHPNIDLIVWPESMFTATLPWIDVVGSAQPPAGAEYSPEEFDRYLNEMTKATQYKAESVAQELGTSLLVGTACVQYRGARKHLFNSALWLDQSGQLQGRYDKMHPVMFGEYVPFGEMIPWLYSLTPMHKGLTAGQQPVAVELRGLILSPCICFENTVPQLLRSQVRQLDSEGHDPDVLVTITNDGWFWGSALLDVHLACGVFRAIELRRPMLIAANTGFSAWVDASGKVLDKGPRRDTGSVIVELPVEPLTKARGSSVYLQVGDLFSWLCVGLCMSALAVAGNSRWRRAMAEPGSAQSS